MALLWSTKRKILYGGGFLLFLFLMFLLFLFLFFYKSPSCNDGVKNGDENGVDCGGSCTIICNNETLSPVILWSKSFDISGDVYSLVAFIENPNINSLNKKAFYEFRVYDDNNDLIFTKTGQSSIPKNKKFTVFENNIILKNKKPKRVDFKFTSFSPWEKNFQSEPELSLKYGAVTSATTNPSLVGNVMNKSIFDIKELELVVLLFDDKENVLGVSRTYIENLKKNSAEDFVFTWQKPFSDNISVVNVIYRFIK